MDLREEKKRREDFLVTLWEMHGGNYGGDRPTRELCNRIGIDYETDGHIVGQYLYRAELVKWGSFDWISLTPKGIMEAEKIVEQRYAETEIKVLRKIYDLSKQNTAEPVFLHQLEAGLGMGSQQVTGFCKGLNEQGFIDWPPEVDSYLYITRQGIEAIQSSGKPRQSTGGDNYTLNIKNMHGGVQQGSGNTQSIQINQTNNPEFDQAIASLLQIVNSSGLPSDEIEELREEVNKLNRLALSEPKPDSFEKAKFRLDKAKLTFEGTKLLVQAAPYLHTVAEYLKTLFS